MEKAGLNLAPSKQSIPYLDSSTQPATPHAFDHTADGPHQYQHVPVAPQRLDDPSHPDHPLYQQARRHVVALDQSLGRTPDVHTDQLASAAAVQARADGLQRVRAHAGWPEISKKVTRYSYSMANHYERSPEREVDRMQPTHVSHSL